MILLSWNTPLVYVLFRIGGLSHLVCYLFNNSNPFKVVLSYGAFVWFPWLVDILYGLHSDLAVSYISSREIWIKMPSSGSKFQEIYNAFLEDKGTHSTTSISLSQDGAVLILVAILYDVLYICRSICQHDHHTNPAKKRSEISTTLSPLFLRTPKLIKYKISSRRH